MLNWILFSLIMYAILWYYSSSVTASLQGSEGKKKKKEVNSPVTLINDLTPSIAIEILARQLARRQKPRAAIAKRGIGEDGWCLLTLLDTHLQAEEMPVHAPAVGRGANVLDMGVQCRAEQANALILAGGRVGHGIAEGDTLVRDGAARLCSPKLEAPSGGRLIRRPVLAVHLVVGQLDNHLHVRVWGAAELLDEALAVALVGLHPEIVLADLALEVALRRFNVLGDLGVQRPSESLRFGQVRPDLGVVEVEGVGEDQHVGVVVDTVRRSAVHHAVLSQEAGRAVVVDHELQRLIVPAVRAVAVPVLACAFVERDGSRVVEADEEGAGFEGVEDGFVARRSGEEMFAGIGPGVTVLRGEEADRRRLFGVGVDATELLLEFGGVELLATVLVVDFEELVLADDDDVRVLLVVVFHRVVGGLGGNAAGVEHPLVAGHGHGKLPHVFRLQGLLVHLLLEFEHGRG